MKFFLSVNIPKYTFQLDHHQKIFMAGSCFSEHIYEKMLQNGFHVASNPWGILFNPISLALMTQKMIEPNDLSESILPVKRDEIWYSLHQHSLINEKSEEELLNKVDHITIEASEKFKTSDIFIVTFGSAYVYEYKERRGEVVANCHKLPNTLFNKRLLEVNQIVET